MKPNKTIMLLAVLFIFIAAQAAALSCPPNVMRDLVEKAGTNPKNIEQIAYALKNNPKVSDNFLAAFQKGVEAKCLDCMFSKDAAGAIRVSSSKDITTDILTKAKTGTTSIEDLQAALKQKCQDCTLKPNGLIDAEGNVFVINKEGQLKKVIIENGKPKGLIEGEAPKFASVKRETQTGITKSLSKEELTNELRTGLSDAVNEEQMLTRAREVIKNKKFEANPTEIEDIIKEAIAHKKLFDRFPKPQEKGRIDFLIEKKGKTPRQIEKEGLYSPEVSEFLEQETMSKLKNFEDINLATKIKTGQQPIKQDEKSTVYNFAFKEGKYGEKGMIFKKTPTYANAAELEREMRIASKLEDGRPSILGRDETSIYYYGKEKSTLDNFLKRKDSVLSDIKMAEDIGEVVGSMHKLKIKHNDLTRENIAFIGKNEEGNYILEIVDFGEAIDQEGLDLVNRYLRKDLQKTLKDTDFTSEFERLIKDLCGRGQTKCADAVKAGYKKTNPSLNIEKLSLR